MTVKRLMCSKMEDEFAIPETAFHDPNNLCCKVPYMFNHLFCILCSTYNYIGIQLQNCLISPLMLKCLDKNCDVEIIKRLLDAGANINQKTVTGCTALHICSAVGNFEILKLLINHGGNISITDESGMTPILNAAIERRMRIVNYLAKQKTPNEISLEDRINAFDLLGAMFIQYGDSCGILYWEKAINLRYINGVLIYEKEDNGVSDDFKEIITIEQLEEIKYNHKILKIQSLLVKERILGQAHKITCDDFEFVRHDQNQEFSW